MCGRFGIFAQLDEIENYFDEEFTFDHEPSYNIGPVGPGIAAIQNETPDESSQYEWSHVPHWVDDPDDFPALINSRTETVAGKPAFWDGFIKRWSLVFANNIY